MNVPSGLAMVVTETGSERDGVDLMGRLCLSGDDAFVSGLLVELVYGFVTVCY
ncbi:MAG: hypothetical protein LBJ43_03415 [Propionibacteriaceae bacterium]|nr:hypothetical protein [Propionibacteriaceae bacterium]